MELQRPSIRLLYAWWLALFAATLAVCCAAAAFITFSRPLWVWVTVLFLFAFFVGFVWVLPARYRRLSYGIQDHLVMVRCGIIGVRYQYILTGNIRFASMDTFLPFAPFGLATATLRTAGATLRIPGLDAAAQQQVKEKLSPCLGNLK